MTRNLTARREYGPHDTVRGEKFGGRWVVRDDDGDFVDVHSYRAVLRDRYPHLKVDDTEENRP